MPKKLDYTERVAEAIAPVVVTAEQEIGLAPEPVVLVPNDKVVIARAKWDGKTALEKFTLLHNVDPAHNAWMVVTTDNFNIHYEGTTLEDFASVVNGKQATAGYKFMGTVGRYGYTVRDNQNTIAPRCELIANGMYFAWWMSLEPVAGPGSKKAAKVEKPTIESILDK
jgi:hypothetical protein